MQSETKPRPKRRLQTKEAGREPNRDQQYAVDDTIDDSFPASDPPAWTTTGSRSIAAKKEKSKSR